MLASLRNKGAKAYYCDIRTIDTHRQFAGLFPEMLSKASAEHKITWCKRKLGKMNHNLVTTKPRSQFKNAKIDVILRGFPKMRQFEVSCLFTHRINNVIRSLELHLQQNFQDYVLVAEINNTEIVLGDDEIIGNFIKQD
jgi:hypothetical protein